MKTISNSKQQREGEKRKALVEGRYSEKMVGSTNAEAQVIEATDQRKETGRKRVKTRAEKDAHNARCVAYRKNKKLKFEELEQLVTEMVPKMAAEIEAMKTELMKTDLSKMQRLENENMQLRGALKEQAANQENMMRLFLTCLEIHGLKFSSLEHFQNWILSQNYDQQFSQGSNYNITASDAGPSSIANPDFTTQLGANPLSHDLAADNITGILGNPGAGSFFGSNHGLPVFDADASNHDNIGLFTHDPAAGTLSNPGVGSFGSNHEQLVFDAGASNHDNIGLFTHDPAAGTLSNPGAGYFGANQELPAFNADNTDLLIYDPADGSLF